MNEPVNTHTHTRHKCPAEQHMMHEEVWGWCGAAETQHRLPLLSLARTLTLAVPDCLPVLCACIITSPPLPLETAGREWESRERHAMQRRRTRSSGSGGGGGLSPISVTRNTILLSISRLVALHDTHFWSFPTTESKEESFLQICLQKRGYSDLVIPLLTPKIDFSYRYLVEGYRYYVRDSF
jgi:hypothetical protein